MYDDVGNLQYSLANSDNEFLLNNTIVCLPHKKFYYCTCSFMRNVYVFSGEIIKSNHMTEFSTSCLKYDTKSSQWSYIAEMNIARGYAACTVFEGKIVVSGGYSNQLKHMIIMKTNGIVYKI